MIIELTKFKNNEKVSINFDKVLFVEKHKENPSTTEIVFDGGITTQVSENYDVVNKSWKDVSVPKEKKLLVENVEHKDFEKPKVVVSIPEEVKVAEVKPEVKKEKVSSVSVEKVK